MTILNVVLTLHLALGMAGLESQRVAQIGSQDASAVVQPLNPSEMPLTITEAHAKNLTVGSWLHWTVTNFSSVDVSEMQLRIFILDPQAKLVETENASVSEPLPSGSTRSGQSLIGLTISPHLRSFAVITKAKTRAGIWYPDQTKFEGALRARVNQKPDVYVPVTYEPNAKLTMSDRNRILGLVLEDMLRDSEKGERLGGRSRIVILKESIKGDLPEVPGALIMALTAEEIREIALKEKRVVFLAFEPFVVEGSQVFVRTTVRDRVAHSPGMVVPFKFTHLFTCAKKNGEWSMVDST